MALSDDCPCGRSQLFTFESRDKIVIDRETFKRVFSLVCRSVDTLANVRHREIFLDSLNNYLTESTELDDSDCFRGSLLLDAYYEYVPASLALLEDNLQEAFELIGGVERE
ncbi:MAG: hypothetical protein JGK21_20525 [Microcoleus sp. PH2017_22_RUC_O_B]|uniref:hypothetical protein n=1 Tax=unclassified Microcoleus TaxID=2642155 RepID=UPI001E0005A6|nr:MULTISPECIES: hypothetical protein [unclassified Microcoleus]MCC3530430.1 hypothetical protein [Microcoleus sp. PH2017_21_RUC_O_A]MCC3542696.1 hypothetical protein [Microcoleus sp. PH2017_22_RUC_O_B]